MKIKKIGGTASANLRTLIASLFCLAAGILTLFGVLTIKQQTEDKSRAGSSSWMTRVASTFGIKLPADRSLKSPCETCARNLERDHARGSAAALSRMPEDRLPASFRMPAAVPYTGPVQNLRGVEAVRSGTLRDIPPIEPSLGPVSVHPEPIPPPLPTKSGELEGPRQTELGPLASAPSPTGLSFEGIGEGFHGFIIGSNPPDVEGRVGATQYVQWNNTAFAVFNKTTGALEYGPAAGNTLFQALGGACAAHNDGDPVVSYDILAGRWVISQFAVAVSDTDYSHQCIAVSTTSDATGDYYLYDFVTDPVNFVDYPHTAVWPDGYYMSTHVFGAGLVFTTGRLYVFERERMIYGLPARMQSADLGQEYGFLPADLDSLTPPATGKAGFVLGPTLWLTTLPAPSRVRSLGIQLRRW